MCKFKFNPNNNSFAQHINFMYGGQMQNNIDEIKEEWEFIKKPDCIPISAVREGTYVIRTRGFYQEVEKYKEFWVKKGIWENVMMRATWELFPILSDREYEALSKVPRKVLNKEWITNLNSYLYWKELRKLRRDIDKSFLKILNI